MDFDDIYKKPEEHIIKSTKGSCFGDKETIDGTLILTNLRIYLQIDEEQKMNEIQIRAVIKQGRCKRELYTSFCRKQQSKIEVLYNM